jgi:hypothetical protein
MCRKSAFPIKAMPPVRLMLRTIFMALAFCASAFAQIAQPDNNVELAAGQVTSTVTASATAERVRFTSPNTVVQLRLEVYDEAGQKLLDTEQRGGNVLDWHLQGGAGERVADGVYLCVVTIKNLSGRLTQKLGLITVSAQSTVVRSAAVAELNLRQAQTVGPVEIGEAGLTVMGAEDTPSVTVLAHNGNEAQLARTRGALTFRVGDFFSGNDKEQMRLTEDGNLGIGTTKPKVKLDVAGMIRAREGFMFSDGSTLKLNEKGVLTRANADGSAPSPATTTQNKLAKFTDNAGTVGDSVVTELAANIGIGTTTPTQALDVANGRIVATGSQTLTAAGGILEIGTTVTNNGNQASGIRMRNLFNGNATNQVALDVAPTFAPSASISLARGFISAAFFAPPPGVTIIDANGGVATTVYSNTSGAVTNGTAFAINSPFAFGALKPTNQFGLHINNQGIGGTTTSYGLFVDAQSGSANNFSAIFAGGNVGIGTTIPTAKLDVAGNINTSTQFNIGGNRVFSIAGANNTFAGSGAGTANTTGDNNSFFGFNAGAANTSGDFNAFFGGFAGVTNNTGLRNSFFGDFAGHDNTSGQDNSFFGLKAGEHNNTGVSNTFAGINAGDGNTNGFSNAFFGNHAGENNSTGDKNTVLGADADLSSGNLTNATAIGAQAFVTQSNSLVLGSIHNVNGAAADTKVGIGTSAPARHLHVFGAGDQEIAIESSDIGGRQWTLQSSQGTSGGRFEIVDRTANANRLSILSTGNVGIGTTAPGNRLHVVADVNDLNDNPTLGENVALIENTNTLCCIGVLGLKMGPVAPNSSTNYITFYNGNNASIGAIEGNDIGPVGVSLVGPGNDYAEWLPRLNPAEKIQPGEIVGLNGGRITKTTRGASQIMAVSTGPIVAGNDPGKQARGGYERVAFIGQVMARVRGTVQAGDFIVASGLNDGTGVAVSPERITSEQFEQVAGQAWETSADAGVKSVRVAVGLIRHDPTVSRLLQYSRYQGDRIGALDARLTALEAQLTSKTARTSPLPVTRKKHRLVARLADVGKPRSVRATAGTIR